MVENYNLQEHLEEFKEMGFTIFKQVYDKNAISGFINKFHQFQSDDLDGAEWNFSSICELSPKTMFPAMSNPLILDFAELILGPFVQLDNSTLTGFPSKPKDEVQGKVNGWHRDRYAYVPGGSQYIPPLSINAICYFQDMTDEYGPLRVIPKSHRAPITIGSKEGLFPHPDEILVPMQAGDVVVTHNGLMHTGTPNTSGKIRFFFSAYYNKSWLRYTDNHSGPNVQKIIKEARKKNDHRILRLFGVDDHLFERANCGFIQTDEIKWAEWAALDKAAVLSGGNELK